MITTPETITPGSRGAGIALPDSVTIGSPRKTPAHTIFIQNDTDASPSSAFFVIELDSTHYAMPNATAPRNGRYIGAFLRDGVTGTRGPRTGSGTVWSTSDATVVQLVKTTQSGQAVINILTAGTATLTVSFKGMTSTLLITAANKRGRK